MSLIGINAGASYQAMARWWPHWFLATPGATAMRSRLSSTVSYAHCTQCTARKRCRYEIATDCFFCSEECFGLFYEDEFRRAGLIPTASLEPDSPSDSDN